jgi:hypothetical protein
VWFLIISKYCHFHGLFRNKLNSSGTKCKLNHSRHRKGLEFTRHIAQFWFFHATKRRGESCLHFSSLLLFFLTLNYPAFHSFLIYLKLSNPSLLRTHFCAWFEYATQLSLLWFLNQILIVFQFLKVITISRWNSSSEAALSEFNLLPSFLCK